MKGEFTNEYQNTELDGSSLQVAAQLLNIKLRTTAQSEWELHLPPGTN